MRVFNRSMWRPLLLGAAAAASMACSSGDPTSATSAKISVKLRTDGGTPAGRNMVLVSRADGTPDGEGQVLKASVNGTGEIVLPDAGTYLVRVIPRSSEFLYSDQLQATVAVAPSERLSISFTLYRQGGHMTGDAPIIERGGW